MPPRNMLTEIERMHHHPRAIPNRWAILAAALPLIEEDEILRENQEFWASRTEAERAMFAAPPRAERH